MLVSRALSVALRFIEFVCGAVVLGLMASFLDRYNHGHHGPLAREIYTIIVAALTVVFAVLGMIPTTNSMSHYTLDLFMTAAWFAVFGILVNLLEGANCGGVFHWGNLSLNNDSGCGQWKALEAFSFIAAVAWFVNFLLGLYVWHRVTSEAAAGTHK